VIRPGFEENYWNYAHTKGEGRADMHIVAVTTTLPVGYSSSSASTATGAASQSGALRPRIGLGCPSRCAQKAMWSEPRPWAAGKFADLVSDLRHPGFVWSSDETFARQKLLVSVTCGIRVLRILRCKLTLDKLAT
jgi:hypothetical protein